VLLRRIALDGRDLALEVTLFEREIGAVGELEVVPGIS